MAINYLKDEQGYTLLETVIAMALLVGVLIPVGIVIGNFMLDRGGVDLHSALRLAESEMSRVVTTEDYSSGSSSAGAFSIERTTQRIGNVMRITITILPERDPSIRLCVLQKSLLDYQ